MTTQRLRAGRITAAPSGLGSCPYARRTGGSAPSWKGAGYDWRRSSENYAVAGDSGSNFCRGAVRHLCAVCAGVQPVDAPDRPTALGTLGWPGNIVRGGTFSWRIWNRGSRLPAGLRALPAGAAHSCTGVVPGLHECDRRHDVLAGIALEDMASY